MKRTAAICLIFFLLFTACGNRSDELVIETQYQATVAAQAAVTEAASEPSTETATEPTTIPTTVPAAEATEAPMETSAEELTEEPAESLADTPADLEPDSQDYVLNKSSKKFHYPHCGSVKQMKSKNRKDFFGSREELLSMGYVPCKNCDP